MPGDVFLRITVFVSPARHINPLRWINNILRARLCTFSSACFEGEIFTVKVHLFLSRDVSLIL